MQQYAGICLLQNHSLNVLGVHRTHHQEYINLSLQPLVQVISRIRAKTFLQRGLIRPR